MAKSMNGEMRVLINGDRVGIDSFSCDQTKRPPVVVLNGITLYNVDDVILSPHEIKIVMDETTGRLFASQWPYCAHLHTAPAGVEAQWGGILMDRLQCQDCGKILTRPHVEV